MDTERCRSNALPLDKTEIVPRAMPGIGTDIHLASFKTYPRWIEPVALALLALTLFWLGNDRVALWDRDEPRYVETARNMVETGDFIVPYFNGEFRFQKPVLTYWLVALATRVGGETPFWHRFFAGLCVAGSCLLVWLLGNQMFGRPAGLLAGLMMATCPTVLLLGKLCLPDGPQLFFATACFYCLHRVERRKPGEDAGARRAAFLFWICLAAATLAKGPVVLGMVASTLFAYGLMTGTSPAKFALRWRTGPLVFAAVTLPWLVSILSVSGWGFFHESVGKQLAGRTVTSFDGRWLPPGYYLGSLAVGLAPWLPLAALALIRLWRQWRIPGPVPFLLAWMIGPMLLLELFRSKQPHYYAPAYPAFALLAAGYLTGLIRREHAWSRDIHSRCYPYTNLAAALVFPSGLAAVAIVGPLEARFPAGVGALLTLAGTLWCATRNGRGEIARASIAQIAFVAVGWIIVGGWLMPALDQARVVRAIGERLGNRHRDEGIPVVTHRIFEPSMVYYSKITMPNLDKRPDFLRFARRSDRDFLVPMTQQDYQDLARLLPGRLRIEESWHGWVKMHADTVHLVRVEAEPSRIAASGNDPLQ